MALPPDFYYFVISAFLLMLCPLALVWFWMRGFFFAFLKVKARGGVLVRLRYPTHWRFIPGKIHEGYVVFTDAGDAKRVSVKPEAFYQMIKIWWVDIHPESGAVYLPDATIDYAHDPAKVESLYVRAIMASNVKDLKIIYLVALLILILALTGAGVYFGYTNNELLVAAEAARVAAAKAAAVI